MKLIPLTQGKFAMVDDEDYDFLMQWKWFAKKSGKYFYAARGIFSGKYSDAGNPLSDFILMHRVILNTPKELFGDHVDHNTLNNQKYNLRNCTKNQNGANKSSAKNSTSKYLGVSFKENVTKYNTTLGRKVSITKRWRATIKVNGKHKHLAYFPSTKQGEKDAALCYNEAAKKYHGEFANLNVL